MFSHLKNHLLKSIILLLPLFFVSATSTKSISNGKGRLRVIISGIDPKKGGSLRVAVFNNAGSFLEPKGFYAAQAPNINGQTSMTVDFDLPHATYAVTTYQDFNSNRRIDQNSLGIPQEPYDMSNNPNVKWRAPSYNECKFVFSETERTIYLQLRYWTDR